METRIYKAEYIEAVHVKEEWKVTIGDVVDADKISGKRKRLSYTVPCKHCKYVELPGYWCELFESYLEQGEEGFCAWGENRGPEVIND